MVYCMVHLDRNFNFIILIDKRIAIEICKWSRVGVANKSVPEAGFEITQDDAIHAQSTIYLFMTRFG